MKKRPPFLLTFDLGPRRVYIEHATGVDQDAVKLLDGRVMETSEQDHCMIILRSPGFPRWTGA